MKRLLLLLCCLASLPVVADTIVHREKSMYRNVLVFEYDNLRCMSFTYEPIRYQEQSCYALDKPSQPVHFYSQAIVAGLAFHPEPRRILLIGLGGGIISRTLAALLPEAHIDSVEIDPAVVRIAQEYFLYRPDARQTITAQDGRIFIRRAMMKKQQWDWVILDAFNSDYIPEHLMTREFLQEVKQVLAPDGLLSANTFSNSALFHSENATYSSVFPNMRQVHSVEEGNRILFYRGRPWPQGESLQDVFRQAQPRMEAVGVTVADVLGNLSPLPAWPQDTRLLTDQYAPVNLMRE